MEISCKEASSAHLGLSLSLPLLINYFVVDLIVKLDTLSFHPIL